MDGLDSSDYFCLTNKYHSQVFGRFHAFLRKVPTTNLVLYKFLFLACIKHCELHTVSKSIGASSAGVWNSHNKFTVLVLPRLKLFSFVLFVLPLCCRWRFPGNSANMCLNSTNTSLGKDRRL